MRKDWPILLILALAVVVTVILFASTLCNPTPTSPPPTVTPTSPTVERKTSTWIPTCTPSPIITATPIQSPTGTPIALFQVRRETPVVSKGVPPALSELADDQFQPLPNGHSVTTAVGGEALLTAELGGGTCKVYLFENGRLTKSACPKAASDWGNTACLEEGSALFQDCTGYLIMTPSGEANVEEPPTPLLALLPGTLVRPTAGPQVSSSILVMYNRESQLTLVTVYTGTVMVRPVLQFDSRQLGIATALSGNQFLVTVPDKPTAAGQSIIQELLRQATPVAARTPQPLLHLSPLTVTLGIRTAVGRTFSLQQSFQLVRTPTRTPTPAHTPQPRTVTLAASSDTYVYQGAANQNYGQAATMSVGFATDPDHPCAASWSLFRFDLNAIPDGSRVQSAMLRLHLSKSVGSGTRTFGVAVALTTWNEKTITWKALPKNAQTGIELKAGTAPGWLEYDVSKAALDWVKDKGHVYGLMLIPISKCEGGWERRFDTIEGKSPAQLWVVYLR